MTVYNVTPYWAFQQAMQQADARAASLAAQQQPLPVQQVSPAPPQLQLTWDTIGQVIFRTLGHCRLPFKTIWVEHLVSGFDELITSAITTAGNDTLTFSYVPPWIVAGASLNGVNVPVDATILAVTSTTVQMSAGADGDIPANTVIVINTGTGGSVPQPNAVAISADAAIDGTTLTFATVPDFVVVGAQVAGAGVEGGAVVSSMTSTTVDISLPLTDDMPTGSVVIFTSYQTLSFAAAICRPIDPAELGNVEEIYDGGQLIFSTTNGITPPPNWSLTEQALLIASLLGVLVYPGDEIQEPCPLIVADKGTALTNAFRGLRYIVFPGYPIDGARGGAFPRLSGGFVRSNSGRSPNTKNIIAVTFAAGSG